ncbi:YchA-1 [Escherichia coli TA447]|uniref:YchA-1 n=1 Tax=Escherichia coli TA447 TaxID=656447 RepID=A0A1X3ISA6_ECOLX|nr:YchA-1 [Escherichia coli TA447]
MLCRFCCSYFRRRGHLRLPAAWLPGCLAASGRRPDSDRQLLAHPPVSAEPAGAVSGCRYGPMSEKPGLQRPFRSLRPCRAGNGAPCTPYGV